MGEYLVVILATCLAMVTVGGVICLAVWLHMIWPKRPQHDKETGGD